jgi:hypothetical protein
MDPSLLERDRADHFWTTGKGRKPWPDYLAFFAQIEPALQGALRGSGYGECQKIFNSHWHDDWRRQGDIVVWCLDPQRLQDWHAKKNAPHSTEGKRDKPSDWAGAEQEVGSGQKVLGGVQAKKTEAKDTKAFGPKPKKEPFRRVVEKPFWKAPEPEED